MRKLTNYSLYPFPYIYLCLLLATLVYRIYLALPSNHNQASKLGLHPSTFSLEYRDILEQILVTLIPFLTFCLDDQRKPLPNNQPTKNASGDCEGSSLCSCCDFFNRLILKL